MRLGWVLGMRLGLCLSLGMMLGWGAGGLVPRLSPVLRREPGTEARGLAWDLGKRVSLYMLESVNEVGSVYVAGNEPESVCWNGVRE